MAEEYTAEQREEYTRCANDFSYFAKTYLKIIHPTRGLIPLLQYDYQERLFHHLEKNRFSIVKKFRQGGFTTFMCAYMLWLCMFRLDQHVMFMSRTDREAVSVGQVVRQMVEQLPDWMKPTLSRNNDHLRHFEDTGSNMVFYTPEAACGRAVTWLVIDEAAFICNIDAHWKAIYPTLSCGGKCAVVSTTNGKWRDKKQEQKTWFYDLYTNAKEGKNRFAIFEASYKEHPDFNNVDWVKQMVINLGEKGWLQEVEAEFLD